MQNKLKYYLKLFIDNRYVISFNIFDKLYFFVVFLSFALIYPAYAYGELITIFSLCTITMIIFDLGIPIFLQRNIAISKIESSELFSQLLYLNIIILIFYAIVTSILYFVLYSYISIEIFLLISALVFLSSVSNQLNSALAGLNSFRKRFIFLLITRISILILFIPFLYLFKVELKYLLVILIAGSVLHILMMYNNLHKNGFSIRAGLDFRKIKNIVLLSAPIGLAVLFNFLYDKIDVVLISKLADFSEVAFYNIGYGIYKSSSLAFSFLLISGFTKVSYLSRNKHAVKLFLIKYFKIILVIAILITIFLFSLSGVIINIIYTEKYFNSIFILKILSFAIIGLSLNNLTGIVLNGLGLYKQNMVVTLIGFTFNIILNLFFIPLYGIIAAALISVLTEYIILTGDFFCLSKYFKVK